MKIHKYQKNENTSIHEMIYHEVIKSKPKKILLSGGSTPIGFYSKYLQKIKADYLVVDERITSNNLRRNQANIKKSYPGFQEINFPKDQASIEKCSDKLSIIYESFLPADLCILGMGEDGHYASIFPKHKKIFTCKKNLYFFSTINGTSEIRFSLTKDYILKSKRIILLIKSDNQKKIDIINSLGKNSDVNLPINRLFDDCANKTTIITI